MLPASGGSAESAARPVREPSARGKPESVPASARRQPDVIPEPDAISDGWREISDSWCGDTPVSKRDRSSIMSHMPPRLAAIAGMAEAPADLPLLTQCELCMQPKATVQTIMTHIVRLAPRGSRHARLRRGPRRQVPRREPGRSPLPQLEAGRAGRPRTVAVATWNDCRAVRPPGMVCVRRGPGAGRPARRAPRGTASRNLYYPCCYRDGSEIRPRTASSGGAAPATRRGAAR